MADHHLSCTVCFQPFDTEQCRPWDIGCGHSFCEQCLRQHPRSFRYCPECRTRASNPHVNIALLRLLDAAGTAGTGAAGVQARSNRQQAAAGTAAHRHSSSQQQQQQQVATYTRPTAADAARPPLSSAGALLNPSSRAGTQNPSSAALQTLVPAAGDASTSLAVHQAKIAQLRTAMWVYLTPILGFLYLISPLDLIPDFLPLIGWLDDALVLLYVACSLYSMLGQQQQPQQRNTMQL